jgi:hypothetical protein
MLSIMKKNAVYYIGYLGIIILVTVGLRIALGTGPTVPLVMISGVLIFMLVFGAVFMNEQYEEKHKGYDFLDILPVKTCEIVTAKFGLVLLADIAVVGYLLFLFSFSPLGPNDWALVRSYFLMMGVFCLAFAALSYMVIFIIGYTKFAVIVMTFFVLLGLVPMLIMKFYGGDMDVLVNNILSFLRHLNWLILLPLAFAGYLLLMAIAIKVKEST